MTLHFFISICASHTFSYLMPHFLNERISHIHSLLRKSHCAVFFLMNNARISHAHRANSAQLYMYNVYTIHQTRSNVSQCTRHIKIIFRDLKFESFQYEAFCSVFCVQVSPSNISHWILCAFHKVVSSQRRWIFVYLVQKCSLLWKWHTEKLMAFRV